MSRVKKHHFLSKNGDKLAAIIDWPALRKPVTFAVFAHCFSCNKNFKAVRNVSRSLTDHGLAVMRFDFAGLGDSDGDFADTNFSTNIDDILSAVKYLDELGHETQLLIGHSLGGSAALHAASQLDGIRAVVTIGSPSNAWHVTHLLDDKKEEIEKSGGAEVKLGLQTLTIKKQFLQDLQNQKSEQVAHRIQAALMVMHSPEDEVVEIENAAEIYRKAKHPKNFVSLDGMDHLISNKHDSEWIGSMIATWASRYLKSPPISKLISPHQVVGQNYAGEYTVEISNGTHGIYSDEPIDLGGNDLGMTPYELLSSSLISCTAITLRMYAQRKGWPVEGIRVHCNHGKRYADDCVDCEDPKKKIDHIERIIEIEGDLDQQQRSRLMQIAEKCPVHKTLHSVVEIDTREG